jgi:hypothetical protein
VTWDVEPNDRTNKGRCWTVLRVLFGFHRHPKSQYDIADKMGISAIQLDEAEWTSLGPDHGSWGN